MRKSKLCLGCGTLVCISLALAWLPSLTQPALALPPRPEPTPTIPPTPPISPKPPPVGGFIELHASFGLTWPSANLEWQALWTVVQWQDGLGNWHDVAGWQGTLDKVVDIAGIKAWWVADQDLGKGPFRWAITRVEDGRRLGVSEPFYLPNAGHTTTTVEVSLAP